MSGMETFEFEGQQVRIVLSDDGDPWFVAADVAKVLGHREASDMTRTLDDEDKGPRLVRTLGGDQRLSCISEPGLYAVVLARQTGRIPNEEFRSRVRRFKRRVTHDVLPTIRKTGSYSTVPAIPQQRQAPVPALPGTYLEALRELVVTVERVQVAEARVLEMAPKALLADRILTADGDYSVRETAQSLNRDPSISTGSTRLFRFLREQKWISRDGTPMQRQIDLGRLSAKPRTYPHPHTDEPMLGKPQVRVTGKGIGALHALLGGTGPVLLPDDL